MHDQRRVVVIGGGITGLTTAWQLVRANPELQVRVYEEADILGGKIQTTEFAGKRVDTGADALLARVPEAIDLCNEIGLGDRLVAPALNTSLVWSHGALRRFPGSTVLGIPSDIDDLARSGIISDEGIERARQEIDLRKEVGRDLEQPSIAHLVGQRFGDEIVERLVDPLVGGINAGSVDALDLAAAAPQILDLAQGDASLTRSAQRQVAARPTDPATHPVFLSPQGGMGELVSALVDHLGKYGVELHTQTRVEALGRDDDRWFVTTENDVITADAVIIATPAFRAASLVRSLAPGAAVELEEIRYATVALVRLAYARTAINVDLDATGFVVPAVEGKLLTACSWSSSKWNELADDDMVILRASAGRANDERIEYMTDAEIIDALHAELGEMMNIDARPLSSEVTRWHNAFPQYTPGHAKRVSAIADALGSFDSLALAGAAYEGLGVPACIRSGKRAAERILASQSMSTTASTNE